MKKFLANYMVGKGNQYDLIHISQEYNESFALGEGKLRNAWWAWCVEDGI